jgi:hypothetical protein
MNLAMSVAHRSQLLKALEICLRYTLDNLRKHNEDEGATGVFFSLFFQNHDPAELRVLTADRLQLQLATRVGTMSDVGRASRIEINSFEKAHRLGRHEHRHHVSSWLSRNTTMRQFGGAIRVLMPEVPQTIAIASCSGLPEHGDEALLLLLAHNLDWRTWNDEIMNASNNDIARRMMSLNNGRPPAPLSTLEP